MTLTTRPSIIQVDLKALAHNYSAFKRHVGPKTQVMAVVKANAYGHGIIRCSQHLASLGANYLGVALLEEGLELRAAGIELPILVFGGILSQQIAPFIENKLELTASSVSKLAAIEETASRLKKKAIVHLKIDTGMERVGVHYYSAQELLKAATQARHCEIKGIFSHFASSDSPDLNFTKVQLERFLAVCEQAKKIGLEFQIRHIANSAATLALPESHLDLVRPGIALFGVYPSDHLAAMLELSAVMSLQSKVVYFKVVPKGAGVSYGHSWIAPEKCRIVTVPIGYGDGFPRCLSNRAQVLIRGKRYPIVGNICMDQFMVNLGPDGEAYNGDTVVIIGSQDNNEISVNSLAKLADTIPYEILTHLNLRVPRDYLF